MIYHRYLIAALTFILFNTAYAQSTGGSRTSSKRPWLLSSASDAAEAKRFTLAEWLENKQKSQLMDAWMGYNTNAPDPYEFKLGFNLRDYDYTQSSGGVNLVSKSYKSYDGEFSAYARNVGLTLQYQKNDEEDFNDLTGIFNVRILGMGLQNTHFTLHYGLRTRENSSNGSRMNHQFAAATLQLYIFQSFGILGHYRKYFKSSEAVYGETEGSEYQAGAYLEFGRLRLLGNYFEENTTSELNTVTTDQQRKGMQVGFLIHF